MKLVSEIRQIKRSHTTHSTGATPFSPVTPTGGKHDRRRPHIIAILALLLSCVSARAIDLPLDTAPWSWIEPTLPEDLPPLLYPAYFTELDKARTQVNAGRYNVALLTLAAAKDVDPAEAAVLRSRALFETGRSDDALAALTDPAVEKAAMVRVARGVLLGRLGDPIQAIAILRTVVLDDPDSIPARYHIARLSEQIGDLQTARTGYAWFVDKPQSYLDRWQASADRDKLFEDAERLTLIARAIDRWATLRGAFKEDRKLNEVILGMFVRAYDVIDRSYWPARVAAAEFLIGRDNFGEASEELQRAVRANPNDLYTLSLLGRLAVERNGIDAAEDTLEQIRRLNAGSIECKMLEARTLLLRRRPVEAAAAAQRAVDDQPTRIEALGLLAAVKLVQTRDEEAKDLLDIVDKLDPDNATAYHDCGELLSASRQFARAEFYYLKAIEHAPWWTAPRTALGEMYAQYGEEDKARAALEAANALDPFNVKTVNYLRVLDELAKFRRYETEHFVFLYSEEDHPVVPKVIAPYMESMYAEVTSRFKHEPAFKTVVEVFPDAETFAVRTVGMPGIETYGASVGMVITAVAPRAGKTLGPFNLARVLRHEFTHTLNFSASGNRCPRWLTEGLGVWQENVEYRFEWVPATLYARVTNDQLFALDEIDDALISGRRSGDGEIAYMQSFWVVRYLIEKHGDDSIIDLLEQFKAGKQTSEAMAAVTGEPIRETERKFFAWAREQVKDWGYGEKQADQFKEIAEGADALTKAGEFEQAADLWQDAAKIQPMNTLPNRRLAGIYLKLKQPELAVEQFARILPLELQDNRYAKRVARICRDIGKIDDAIRFATEAMYVDPYDADVHALLAELYDASNDLEKAEAARELADVLKK